MRRPDQAGGSGRSAAQQSPEAERPARAGGRQSSCCACADPCFRLAALRSVTPRERLETSECVLQRIGGWTVASCAALAFAASASGSLAQTAETTLTIESWRNADAAIWSDVIIPAFKAAHPDIDVVFKPSVPTEYNAALDFAPRRRHRRRPHHLPAVRCLARPLQEGLSRAAQRRRGHGEFFRGREERLDDRRRRDDLLRADGLGHPRLHLQQEDFR